MWNTACPTLLLLLDYTAASGESVYKLYMTGGGALFGYTREEALRDAKRLHGAHQCPCWCQRCGTPRAERTPDNPEWICPKCPDEGPPFWD